MWSINNTLYVLNQIPFFFPAISIVESYDFLTISQFTAELNNTSFQCIVDDGTALLRGITTILRIHQGEQQYSPTSCSKHGFSTMHWSNEEAVMHGAVSIGGGTRGAGGATAPPDFKIYAFGPPRFAHPKLTKIIFKHVL